MERIARLVSIAGAAGGAALTAYVGWHGQARILIAPFVVWVVSPFVLCWWAFTRARTARARTAIAWAGAIMAVGSVTTYAARVAWPPRAQGAFVFVIVPPIAWVVLAVAMALPRAKARSRP